MSAGRHTTGPWAVRGVTLVNASGNSIASAGNNRAVLGAELAASLTLAAAAPDLLAALEFAERRLSRMLTVGGGNPIDGEALDAARTAIAKATGAQQ